MLEIQQQLRRKGGSPLDPEKVRVALQRIIEPGYKKGIGLYEPSIPQAAFNMILYRVRASGYLDTSFGGKEFHPLIIRSLTKDQALAEYRASGGKTWVWGELEENMPYTVPKAETLGVMILGFGKNIGSDEAVAIVDELGVRPLVYEHLIQYGIAHPDHQKQKRLVGLGTKHILGGHLSAPDLRFGGVGRFLCASGWGGGWGDGFRFPVVRK